MPTRLNRLCPNNTPRYIRCYDNGGESFDRYTVVFTGRYKHRLNGEFLHYGLSASPCSPQGFGQSGTSQNHIDSPSYKHLGKRINFSDLPQECRFFIKGIYCELWDIKLEIS